MSRIGKRPINLPDKVTVNYQDRITEIKGPKGTMSFRIPEKVELNIQGNTIQLEADFYNDQEAKMMMGTTQSVLSNHIKGVSEGFTKKLILVGVGYRATVNGSVLEMNLGFSHPIKFQLPESVSAQVLTNTQVTLTSCDKQLLGQVCADIRKYRPPEPYKGKGILFEGERIRRKVGKTGKK